MVAEYKGTASFVEKDDAAYRGVIDAKGRDSRGAGNASALITVQLRPEADGTTVAIDTELKISGKIAQFGAGMIQEVSEKLLGQFVGCLEGKLAAPAESTAADPTTAAADPTATAAAAPKAGTGAGAAAEPTATAASTATAEPPATAASTAAAEPAPAAEPAATAEPPTIEPLTIEPSTIAPATAPPAAPTAAARRTFQASAEPEALDLLELAGGSAFKRLLPVLIAGLAAVAVVIIFRTRR